jgi:hypothetical protein
MISPLTLADVGGTVRPGQLTLCDIRATFTLWLRLTAPGSIQGESPERAARNASAA